MKLECLEGLAVAFWKRFERRFPRSLPQCIETLEPRRLLAAVYVDLTSPGPTRDGTSWGSAYSDLQQALAAAQSGDQIHVAEGTYKPTPGTERAASFHLKSGVSLLGGYAGYGAANPDARDVMAYNTTLSGDIGAAGSNADNSYHVLVASAVDAGAVLDGCTITAGQADDVSSIQTTRGSGLYVTAGAAPTVRNCTFIANRATGYGNAVSNDSSGTPSFSNCVFDSNVSAANATAGTGGAIQGPCAATDCIFRNNSATSFGGAIAGSSNTFQLTHCTFQNNAANYGGALWLQVCTATLTDCTFSSNAATYYNGGAVYTNSGTLTASGCTFSGNHTRGVVGGSGGDAGGALYVTGLLTLSNSTFVGNSAVNGGGLYLSNNNTTASTISNCTFEGNHAGSDLGGGGGAANIGAGNPALINCLMSGNTATGSNAHGGAVYTWYGTGSLVNCTIVGNSAESAAGGIYDNSSTRQLVNVTNCIIRSNTAAFDPQAGSWWTNLPLSAAWSDVEGAGGSFDADARFVRSPSPGLDNNWGTADDDYGDLHLQTGSACINAGSNAAVPSGVATDLDSNERVVYGTVDMGASEWHFPADANGDRSVDLTDFTILAAKFNQTGRTFSQGNFDYSADGKVDLTDFTILAANFNKTLSAPAAAAAMTTAATAPAGAGLPASTSSKPSPLAPSQELGRQHLVDSLG